MKSFDLDDILTPSEIEQARDIYGFEYEAGMVNSRLVSEIVEPNIARINAKLGQTNDPRYIGYAIEYCLMCENKTDLVGPRHNRKWKVR